MFSELKMLCKICTHAIVHFSSEPNVNARLLGIIIYQCKFVSCNKCVPVVVDIHNGGRKREIAKSL
jgi:hypothetical protein